MGANCSSKSSAGLIRCLTCTGKKQVKHLNSKQTIVIKEVFILFMIFDYLPFTDLVRISRVSRGLYWLSGN